MTRTNLQQSYAHSLQVLLSHQKTARGAPAYSLYINRPLGRRAAAMAHLAGLSPNQVTTVSAGFTFAGIAVIALVAPSTHSAVIVALLLMTGYALDSADGQLARLRGGGAPAGEWLDHVLDAAKTATLHAAVLVSFYRFFDVSPLVLLVPLLYLVTATTWFFTVVLTDQLRRAHRATGRAAAAPARGRKQATVRSLLALPTDYGLLCLTFLLLGAGSLFVLAYSLMLLGTLFFFGAALVSWFRELDRFEPTQVKAT